MNYKKATMAWIQQIGAANRIKDIGECTLYIYWPQIELGSNVGSNSSSFFLCYIHILYQTSV